MNIKHEETTGMEDFFLAFISCYYRMLYIFVLQTAALWNCFEGSSSVKIRAGEVDTVFEVGEIFSDFRLQKNDAKPSKEKENKENREEVEQLGNFPRPQSLTTILSLSRHSRKQQRCLRASNLTSIMCQRCTRVSKERVAEHCLNLNAFLRKNGCRTLCADWRRTKLALTINRKFWAQSPEPGVEGVEFTDQLVEGLQTHRLSRRLPPKDLNASLPINEKFGFSLWQRIHLLLLDSARCQGSSTSSWQPVKLLCTCLSWGLAQLDDTP